MNENQKRTNEEVKPRLRFMRKFRYDPILLKQITKISGKDQRTVLNTAYLLLQLLEGD